jgi:Xaa-Pro aminopeptidase
MDLTPHLEACAERRHQWLQQHPNAALILFNPPLATRNLDVHHPYRPDSNVHYFSAWPEPDSVLLFTSKEVILFVEPKNEKVTLWEGEVLGLEGALEYGATRAYPREDFLHFAPQLLAQLESVYITDLLPELVELRSRASRRNHALWGYLDAWPSIRRLRMKKSPLEVHCLQEACERSGQVHLQLMKTAKEGDRESTLDAVFEYQAKLQGLERLSYPSIVASGKNATVLHYRSQKGQLQAEDLVLIDAGGEYEMYCADITRTFPVTRFTPLQADIYDVVLAAQKAAIEACQPGGSLSAVHAVALLHLQEGLKSLQLLKDPEWLKEWYPHRTSHHLGLDVHDPSFGDELEAQHVITIEPGLYFQSKDTRVPQELRGLGIRIEDDIYITPQGKNVLSSFVPKERKDLDALRP